APTAGSQGQGSVFFIAPLGLHQGDQLPGNEGKGHEDGGQGDAGDGEDDLDVALVQILGQPAVGAAEDQDEDQACNDRGNGEGQVEDGDEQALAPVAVLGDDPGGGDAKDQVHGHRDGSHFQGEEDGRHRVVVGEGLEVELDTPFEGLVKHRNQGHQEEEGQEGKGNGEEDHLHPNGFGDGTVGRWQFVVPDA